MKNEVAREKNKKYKGENGYKNGVKRLKVAYFVVVPSFQNSRGRFLHDWNAQHISLNPFIHIQYAYDWTL